MKKRWMILTAAMLLMPVAAARAQTLRVTFYGLDKADAALIETPQGQRVLIDAGTNKDGKRLAERFEAEGIDALDVMIVSHFDKDHVGGADKVLEAVRVARVIMPRYEKDSGQYEDFLDALQKSEGTRADVMGTGERLDVPLEGVTLSLTAAHRTNYGKDEENDFSLAARLAFGDVRFLFPGDAEDARQRELLLEGDVACDVLKVPHHGRLHGASAAFLSAASPSIAFVPDGEEEPADEALLSLLEELGAQVFTARDGDLTVETDGRRVVISK